MHYLLFLKKKQQHLNLSSAANWVLWVSGLLTLSTLYTGDFQMSSFANSEDPDEMTHNAAFHQGLHCLLLQKTLYRERNTN